MHTIWGGRFIALKPSKIELIDVSGRSGAAKRKKKDKVAEKVSKEKKEMTTFAQAMPNCGIWIEDEHVWDPDEVDEGDLAGAD